VLNMRAMFDRLDLIYSLHKVKVYRISTEHIMHLNKSVKSLETENKPIVMRNVECHVMVNFMICTFK
jgi:hypothetical protein